MVKYKRRVLVSHMKVKDLIAQVREEYDDNLIQTCERIGQEVGSAPYVIDNYYRGVSRMPFAVYRVACFWLLGFDPKE